MSMKQGIVTILGSDCEKNTAASIRRTLSADMSSKKWLEQNGFFSPLKKVASSEAVPLTPDNDSSSFSSEGEEECERINNNPGQDDVWRMIHSQKEVQKPAKLDVNWAMILNQKSENSVCNLPSPPYVHPLVKRSATAMSDKSLEICTESLGSETGSDGFSTCLNSEVLGDGDEDKEERTRVGKECTKEPNPFEDFRVVKYKSCPPRPIPPPLSSISGGDGVSLNIRSHRKNSRLVLEAVAVPPKKYFHAQRGDGRLVLSLINSPTPQLENDHVEGNKVDEFEKVFGHMKEVDDNIKEAVARVDDGDSEEEDPEFLEEQNSKSLPDQMMRVDKSALKMKKSLELSTKIPTWSHKFNRVVDFPDAEEIMAKKDVSDDVPISHSLPPLPRKTQLISPPPPLLPPPSAATSFKAYECFWLIKTTVAGRFINPKIPSTPQAASFKNSEIDAAKAFDQYQEMTPHMKGHSIEYFVPYFRGCNKEPRRSLPISEAHWIATS